MLEPLSNDNMVLFMSYDMASFIFPPSTFLSLILETYLRLAVDTSYAELHLCTFSVRVSVRAVHLHMLDVIHLLLQVVVDQQRILGRWVLPPVRGGAIHLLHPHGC
jgi:hypothetical protein